MTKPDPSVWPASEIEMIPTSELKEAAANSRLHSAEQVAQIAKSIQQFGWTIPVLVDEDGVLIAGHARVRAAVLIGIEEIPCMVAAGWSEAKKEAYQIADNRLAENSTWDDAILTAQVKRLAAVDFDLTSLGLDLTKFDLGEAFDPNLSPKAVTKDVDAGDMTKAAGKLDNLTGGAGEGPKKYEVVCPHCGEDFEVVL